jgi:glutamine amidotransferase
MAAPRIVVVDYHKGNLLSVERGLARHGVEVEVTDDPARIARAQAAVVPGVGAFDDAMTYMRASGQDEAVRGLARAGRPLLGICLGMQLLFQSGCERAVPAAPGEPDVWTEGLGLLPGKVVRLEGAGVKVPHVGWNAADLAPVGARCPLFSGLPDATYFYFTHSYVCAPADDACAAATTEHGQRFVSAVWDGGAVFGTQFHPEKSSEAGQVLMGNFAAIVKERAL